jgi:quercetin dioxygenase-like cupin family protein
MKNVIWRMENKEENMAEDPIKVDPNHYKVEFENDQVRVLRVSYGPHEKSVMHEHPMAVGVHLTDLRGKFTLPDGKTEEISGKAGEAKLYPAGSHLPENLSDKPLELILVELKAKSAS